MSGGPSSRDFGRPVALKVFGAEGFEFVADGQDSKICGQFLFGRLLEGDSRRRL